MNIKIDIGSGITTPLGQLVFIITWMAGMILAKGFWSTFFAFLLPPWGWYLIVEKLLMMMGWI